MRELQDILQFRRDGATSMDDAILATVVHVKGSAYRRPGARMLILPDGKRIGTISGGCLESSVTQRAAWWTALSGTAVRQFDTSQESAAWDFGLGCNGVITVLLERASNPAVDRTLAFLDDLHWRSAEGIIATVIRSDDPTQLPVAARLFVEDGELHAGEWSGSPLGEIVLEAAASVAQERRSRSLTIPGADLFLEWIEPPPELVLFGAGHDVIPVHQLAQSLGWAVTIAEDRPAYARPDRFPGAKRVVVLDAAADLKSVPIHSRSLVVLMTHNYPLDCRLLPQILPRRPQYLGLLGPRSRTERLFGDLNEDLEDYDLHAPIGLDLGGEGPSSIALSIVSEIQAVLNARSCMSLRERSGPIHQRLPESTVGGGRNRAWVGSGPLPERVICEISLAREHA